MHPSNPDGDDQSLIRRIRSGDLSAEAELYTAHVGVALKRALQRGAQRADAEDFVAEAFLRLLRQLRGGAGPTKAFAPYLNASLRNLAADAHRGQRGREWASDEVATLVDRPLPGNDPQDEIEVRLCVQAAMRALPPHWRDILWRVHVEGHTVASIAAQCGTNAPSISALAYRARKALRAAFEQAQGATHHEMPESAPGDLDLAADMLRLRPSTTCAREGAGADLFGAVAPVAAMSA